MHKFILVFLFTIFSGCTFGPSNIYSWNEYNRLLLARAQGNENKEQDVERLEQFVNSAPSSTIPPGLSAHLGLLYLELFNQPKALEAFNREQMLFPESTVFIQSLMTQVNPPQPKAKKKQ